MKNLKKFTAAMHEAAAKDASLKSCDMDGLLEILEERAVALDTATILVKSEYFAPYAIRLALIAAEIARRVS